MRKIWKPALLLLLCALVFFSSKANAKYTSTVERSFHLEVVKGLTGTVTLDNPDPAVGTEIKATVKFDQTDAKVSYQWYRIGKDGKETKIDKATNRAYTATLDDIDCTLAVQVSDKSGTYQGYLQAITNPVQRTALTGTVTLTPTEKVYVNNTITADVTGLPARAVAAYQWYRVENGRVAIDGATELSYRATEADNGKMLVCVVTDSANYYRGSIEAQKLVTDAGAELAFAVYSADDNSLSFYRDYEQMIPGVDTTYKGKKVTAVYTGIEEDTYTYSPSGSAAELTANSTRGWNSYQTVIKSVTFHAKISPSSTAAWFAGFKNCESFTGLDNLNTSGAKSMAGMFLNCRNLTDADLYQLTIDTSSATTLEDMFRECVTLTGTTDGQPTFRFESSAATSRLTNLRNMFRADKGLKKADLSGLKVGAEYVNLAYMFFYCQAVEEIKLWESEIRSFVAPGNYSKSNYGTAHMFENCWALKKVDISFIKCKTTSGDEMFSNCKALTTIWADTAFGWDESVSAVVSMFATCTNLVGGNGTSFTATEILEKELDPSLIGTNKTPWANSRHARIDGHHGFAGYLTGKHDQVNHAQVTVTVDANAGFTWSHTAEKSGFVPAGQHAFFANRGSIVRNALQLTAVPEAGGFPGGVKVTIDGGTPIDVYHNETHETGLKYDMTTGVLTIPAKLLDLYSTIRLEASAPRLTHTLTNLTATPEQGELSAGVEYSVTLSPEPGYGLPDTVTVAIDGTVKTEADGVTYDSQTGIILVPGNLVKAGTTVSVTAEGRQLVPVTTNVGDNLTATCAPAVPVPEQDFVITLNPAAGYVLPKTVTVTINGEDKTANVTYENSVITIPGNLVVTDNAISVTAEAKQQITVSINGGLTATYGVPIPNQDFIVTLTGDTRPYGVTVSIDGTVAATAVYNKEAGTITIPGDLLTNAATDITITEIPAPVCTCETRCAEGMVNTECPVCSMDTSKCSSKEPESLAQCVCTVKCEEAPNDQCTVCKTEEGMVNCNGAEPITPTCSCITAKCTEEAPDKNCEVCKANYGDCEFKEDDPQTPAEPSDSTEADPPAE